MENNPIKVMYDEHFIIKKSEKIINSIDCLWEKDASRYIEIVTQLVDFFRNYSDGYHHHKEEGILFPAIKNHPDFVLQEISREINTIGAKTNSYLISNNVVFAKVELEKAQEQIQNIV